MIVRCVKIWWGLWKSLVIFCLLEFQSFPSDLGPFLKPQIWVKLFVGQPIYNKSTLENRFMNLVQMNSPQQNPCWGCFFRRKIWEMHEASNLQITPENRQIKKQNKYVWNQIQRVAFWQQTKKETNKPKQTKPTKHNKTKQNKTNKTKQDQTRENKTKLEDFSLFSSKILRITVWEVHGHSGCDFTKVIGVAVPLLWWVHVRISKDHRTTNKRLSNVPWSKVVILGMGDLPPLMTESL